MPPNFSSTTSGTVAGDLEGLVHDLRLVVPDRARRQFDAVADDVVLVAEHVLRVLGLQRLEAALGHGERIVREVDLLFLVVPFIHREVDDPAELEAVLGDHLQVLAGLGAGGAGELGELFRHAADEEDRVAVFEPELGAQPSVRSAPMFLATGPAPSPSRKKM